MPIDVDAEVLANTHLSNDYNILALAAPAVAETALPGQFVMIRVTSSGDPMLRRPFSIFEILRDARGAATGLTLLNKRVGVGTAHLFAARPGDRVGCLGPLGRPFVPVDPPAEAWMVAGGVGLAPFATLADELAKRGTPSTLFYGGRRASDVFHAPYFERLGIRLALTTEDGSLGEAGRVTLPLERALKAASADAAITIYACGPTPMMRAVAELGERYRRPVFVSLEPVMGCGMGGCYSCVVRVRRGPRGPRGPQGPQGPQGDDAPHFVRSCLEGPVFDAHIVQWAELKH